MSIGYVGLGSMGGALAERLRLTHALHVHDRSRDAVQRLLAAGAIAVSGPAAIAETCDLIFLCLPTPNHVRAVIFGPSGLAKSPRPGTMIVDQTTGDPNQTRAMAADLAPRGVEFIDAPVSGGIAGAAAGTIAIIVGADDAQFTCVLPILRAISPNVFHAGGVGNGHVIKLVNNLMSCVQRLLSFEAMALAAKNGLDPRVANQALLASGGRNAHFEKMMGPRVLQGKLDVGFTLGLAHKDVRLACQLELDSGVPMFLGNVARELYQTCISERGAGDQVDTAGIVIARMGDACRARGERSHRAARVRGGDEMNSDLYEKGLAVRREVVGAEVVERSLAAADDFTMPMQEMLTEFCWGAIWTHPGLDRRSRSILNLGMLAAANRPDELAGHIRGAIANGLTKGRSRSASFRRRSISACLRASAASYRQVRARRGRGHVGGGLP